MDSTISYLIFDAWRPLAVLVFRVLALSQEVPDSNLIQGPNLFSPRMQKISSASNQIAIWVNPKAFLKSIVETSTEITKFLIFNSFYFILF